MKVASDGADLVKLSTKGSDEPMIDFVGRNRQSYSFIR